MQFDMHTETFDKSAEAAKLCQWTEEVAALMGCEQIVTASRAFSAVLNALRSHLPSNEAARFGAQLPIVVRDVYYEGHADALDRRTAASFLRSVAVACPELTGKQVERAIWSVFKILSHHVSPEAIRSVCNLLPLSIRVLWNTAA